MLSKWVGMGLLALPLAFGTQAKAQYLPRPVGAARMPEPAPLGAKGPPAPPLQLVEGPISPEAAPPGPGLDMSLSEEHTSAFQAVEPCSKIDFVVGFGSIGLVRQGLGSNFIGVTDTAPQSVIGNFDTIQTGMGAGFKGSAMLVGEYSGLEVAGFAVGRERSSTSIGSPSELVTPSFSRLDLPFFNAPRGFEGNNGLWRQADSGTIQFETSLASAEANIRVWSNIASPFEGIFGLRFFDHKEALDYTTVDDQFQRVINGGDPRVIATYETRVRNRVIAPQLGIEGHFLPFNWLSLSYMGKGMAGLNLVDRQISLRRGDGVYGFRTEDKNLMRFAHAYELSFNAEISLLEKARLRAGYNFFWLVDVATAVGQIDYDLSHTAGRRNSSDSVYYHGPSIELQFIF